MLYCPHQTYPREKALTMMTYVKLLLMAVFWGGTFIAGRVVAGDVQPFFGRFYRVRSDLGADITKEGKRENLLEKRGEKV
jgi:hypothetical protein